MTDKSINIGNGAQIKAPVTIADTIQDSFNALKQSGADEETKALLSDLLQAIAAIGKQIEESKAGSLADDADTLVREIVRDEPRRKWYQLTLESIRDTALAIGVAAKPIADIVEKLWPLLLPKPPA